MSDVAPSTPYQGEIKPKDGKVWLLNLDMVEPNTGKIIEKLLVDPKDIGNSTLMFSPKNVLYSKLRPYLNKVVVPDDYGYATTEMVPLLPSNKNLDPGFFSALLRGNEFLNYIETQATGTKMPRVQMNIFWNIDVILPPLELQERFAAFVRQSDKSKFVA